MGPYGPPEGCALIERITNTRLIRLTNPRIFIPIPFEKPVVSDFSDWFNCFVFINYIGV
jgi:hypothetical protein